MFIALSTSKVFRSVGVTCTRSPATAHGTPEGVLHVSKFARAINISLLQSEERIRLSLGTLSLFWARTIMIWLRLCRAVQPLCSLRLCGEPKSQQSLDYDTH